jgi:hypothetical protein
MINPFTGGLEFEEENKGDQLNRDINAYFNPTPST